MTQFIYSEKVHYKWDITQNIPIKCGATSKHEAARFRFTILLIFPIFGFPSRVDTF